jgi:hypothetical protein
VWLLEKLTETAVQKNFEVAFCRTEMKPDWVDDGTPLEAYIEMQLIVSPRAMLRVHREVFLNFHGAPIPSFRKAVQGRDGLSALDVKGGELGRAGNLSAYMSAKHG